MIFGKDDEIEEIVEARTPDEAHDAAIEAARAVRSFRKLPTVYAEKISSSKCH